LEKILPVEAAEEDPGHESSSHPARHADLAGSQKFNYHDARYIWSEPPLAKRGARGAALLQNCFCGNSTRKSRATRFR